MTSDREVAVSVLYKSENCQGWNDQHKVGTQKQTQQATSAKLYWTDETGVEPTATESQGESIN